MILQRLCVAARFGDKPFALGPWSAIVVGLSPVRVFRAPEIAPMGLKPAGMAAIHPVFGNQ
jgi:hypothetical protein